MADDSGNEDQWLYGDTTENTDNDTQDKTGLDSTEENAEHSLSNDNANDTQNQETEGTKNGTTAVAALEPASITAPAQQDGEEDEAQTEAKDGEGKENGDGDDDDDSDEDDVHVIINDIKTSPTYTSLNIKRGGLLTSSTGDKLKQPGKFSIEEFEAVGSINGVPAHEFNLDSVEDKPWRKPGADITDYFNYGFNEETWRAYCERQKRLRIHESGVGLAQLGSAGAGRGVIPVAITNDNSKYSGFMGPKKAGPPPGRKMAGTIDVIGVGGLASRRNNEKGTPPKENVIQVMTADRREYSRKPFPDMSVPPPATFDLPPPPHGVIPTTFAPPPGHVDNYGPDFYSGEPDPYYQAYEPTQDLQWKDTPSGQGIKLMTPRTIVTTLSASGLPPDSMSQDSRGSEDASVRRGRSSSRLQDEKDLMVPGTEKEGRERKERGERSDKERHRDRTHRRRDRSRSRSMERRSRRHKSRSRSPGHRSHRKKKSRHAEREKSKEESE